jgi:integrase
MRPCFLAISKGSTVTVKRPSKRPSIKVKFTAALIDSLDFARWPKVPTVQKGPHALATEPTPEHVKDWTVRDTQTPGLGVRLTRGSKTYFVQRKRKGSTSDRWVLTEQHSLTAARAQAAAWYVEMGRVEDPRQKLKARADAGKVLKAQARNTFGHVFTDFITEGEERVKKGLLKASTLKDRKQVIMWMGDSDLWSVPLHLVDTEAVEKTFAPLFKRAADRTAERRAKGEQRKRGEGIAGGVATVHKCFRYCSGAWTSASGAKAAQNPFTAWRKGVRRSLPKVVTRQTRLPTAKTEGQAWLKALNALRAAPDHATSVISDYILIAALWGGRKEEMAAIRWIDIRQEDHRAMFAAETTKGNADHYIPLTPWASAILDQRRDRNLEEGFSVEGRDLVFPYPDTATGQIRDYRPVTRLLQEQTGLWIRLHDLRRTLASEIFGTSQSLGTVAVALGHRSGQQVSQDYVGAMEAIEGLRPLYEAREGRLRRLIGLDEPEPMAALTDQQKALVEGLASMLKQQGIPLDALLRSAKTI